MPSIPGSRYGESCKTKKKGSSTTPHWDDDTGNGTEETDENTYLDVFSQHVSKLSFVCCRLPIGALFSQIS